MVKDRQGQYRIDCRPLALHIRKNGLFDNTKLPLLSRMQLSQEVADIGVAFDGNAFMPQVFEAMAEIAKVRPNIQYSFAAQMFADDIEPIVFMLRRHGCQVGVQQRCIRQSARRVPAALDKLIKLASKIVPFTMTNHYGYGNLRQAE